MAHKKAGSSSKNGRDSVGQRLGVKVGDGQLVPAGSIIVRQRGMTFLAGDGDRARPRLHRLRDGRPARSTSSTRPSRRSASASSPSQADASASHRSRRPPAGDDPHGRRRRRPLVKPDIHPKYYQAEVHCGSCGTSSPSARRGQELRVDVCSNCHPFYTGKQTIIDTAGQVERFQKRLERSARRSRPGPVHGPPPRSARVHARPPCAAGAR